MATLSPTPLDKLILRTRLPWHLFIFISGGILLALPAAAVYLDGDWALFIDQGGWRQVWAAPVIVIYILALARPMQRYRAGAIDALREVVSIDDSEFDELVQEVSDVDDRSELVVFILGAAFGLLLGAPWSGDDGFSWLQLVFVPITMLMYGLMAWIAFTSLASTRLESALHEQPMEIDIFDLSPFVPIGRYSLFTSLAFVGGSAISALFVNPFREGPDPVSLLIYGLLGAVAILVFFLGMRHTHRALAEAKAAEIAEVQQHIIDIFRSLRQRQAAGEDVGIISTELNLWTRYEERLHGARTWPYDTGMLRALFLSIFFPVFVSQVQGWIVGLLFP